MTSLLARVGALETRLASQIVWHSGKRKRGEWICADCRRRSGVKQRRGYSDDTARVTSGLFPPFGLYTEETSYQGPLSQLPEWLRKGKDARVQEVDDSGSAIPIADAPEAGADPHGDEVDQFWEQLEQFDGNAVEADAGIEDGKLYSTFDPLHDPLLDVDYASELGPALLQGSADLVARCLLAAASKNDYTFLQSIPGTSFSECIQLLQPSNVSADLTTAHVEISEAMTKVFGIAAADQVAWEYGKLLREVKATRNAAGIRSTLADYRMLLRAARDLGSKAMADNMWASLLHDEVIPDTQCYNFYMAAIVFDQVHSAITRHRLRIIPFNQLARRRVRLGREFAAYRMGEHGVKAKVVRFLNDMLRHGAIANEESFRVVITALAREGDIETVKAILQRMWNIDIDGLQSGKADVSKPKYTERRNPLKPTADLLFTVAHAFSINNDIPMALRLVDFIARQYDIEISRETWNQLFEWTFVLSIPRTGEKAQKEKDGQLPLEALLNLWNTMTGAPYFIKPTMGMYNHLIRNLQYRDAVPLMYEKIGEGVELQRAVVEESRQAFKALARGVQRLEQDPYRSPRIPLETLRRNYEHLDLIRKRNHFWTRRWMRLLLSTMRGRLLIDHEQHWSLRMIPRILWEWNHLAGTAGNNIRYEIPGGQLEFEIREEEEVQKQKAVGQEIAERKRAVLEKVPLLLGDEWVFRKISSDTQPDFAWHKFD